MLTLSKGQFFGQTNITSDMCGITLTDTEYLHDKVDWHYHENAYFTLLLEGRMIEGNKNEVYECTPGTLLFHNWHDAHYNTKPEGFTRGFHIEIDSNWFKAQDFQRSIREGSVRVTDPGIKIAAYNIFKESRINDNSSKMAIQLLLLNVISRLQFHQEKQYSTIPKWVSTLREMLHDGLPDGWTLASLAETIDIHPVHLSRDFSKYFGANLGDYIRTVRVQKALSLLADKNRSLSDIAYDCGFADQSHFIRCFTAISHLRPSQFKKMLLQ